MHKITHGLKANVAAASKLEQGQRWYYADLRDTAELNVLLGFLCLSCVTLAEIMDQTDFYFMFGLQPQDMDSEGSTNFRTSILATPNINCELILLQWKLPSMINQYGFVSTSISYGHPSWCFLLSLCRNSSWGWAARQALTTTLVAWHVPSQSDFLCKLTFNVQYNTYTCTYTLRYFKLKQAVADSCLLLATILKRKWQGDGIGHYPSSPSKQPTM